MLLYSTAEKWWEAPNEFYHRSSMALVYAFQIQVVNANCSHSHTVHVVDANAWKDASYYTTQVSSNTTKYKRISTHNGVITFQRNEHTHRHTKWANERINDGEAFCSLAWKLGSNSLSASGLIWLSLSFFLIVLPFHSIDISLPFLLSQSSSS